MSGTIIISEMCGFPTSTMLFDYLVENIRARLPTTAQSVTSKAYQPMDEGGMTFITLAQLDPSEFAEFLNAVRSSFEAERKAARSDAHLTAWAELLALLQEDARYVP